MEINLKSIDNSDILMNILKFIPVLEFSRGTVPVGGVYIQRERERERERERFTLKNCLMEKNMKAGESHLQDDWASW